MKNKPETLRAYYLKNKDKIREYNKEYCLKKTFGITLKEYNNLFTKQDGCCAICKEHQSNFTIALAVDHNHTTQEVRGLLCSKCNMSLGLLNENITLLQAAIDYLTEYKE